jgi:2-hydroxy-3-oxopropionate reductase
MSEPTNAVGFGASGAPTAGRLLANHGSPAVYDWRREVMEPSVAEGAVACPSLAEVDERAAAVFASLPTPDIVPEIAAGEGGLLDGAAMRTDADRSTTGLRVAGVAPLFEDRVA